MSTVLDFLLVHGLFVLDKVNKKSKYDVVSVYFEHREEPDVDIIIVVRSFTLALNRLSRKPALYFVERGSIPPSSSSLPKRKC